MPHVLTIAKRELSSLFFSPVAYVVLGLFGFGTALLFLAGFGPGAPAEMRSLLWSVLWLMIPLVPAISMRLISEEFRSGTIEPLMTLPISDTQVVLGNWLGALGFFLALILALDHSSVLQSFAESRVHQAPKRGKRTPPSEGVLAAESSLLYFLVPRAGNATDF
ncbi:MAG: ABC transporter permease [Proteobacteria bacterium]|nr:ABC transporter permease [Pseudomonadota bacterium]